MGIVLLKVFILLGCLQSIRAQDYYQEVETGEFYDIKSPGYPNPYPAGSYVRWRAVARTGNRLKLSCGYFNIPASTNCVQDRVSISLTGDNTLSDAHLYCGAGTFTLLSENEYLTMVLQSSQYSQGGVFLCNITAIAPTPTCNCGWKKQNRIVGGKETGVNEYPFMAGLVDKVKRQLYCGCTIINKYYVLTAAHCLVRRIPQNLTVLVGDHDITTGADTAASRLYQATNFIANAGYDTVSQANDIALVRVQGPILMSPEVMPVCLPFRYRQFSFTKETVTVLGWGSTRYGAATSNVLMGTDLIVISPAECTSAYGDTVTTKQICTFNQGKDACQSDSGGPVLWQDKETGRVYLAGVISYGIGCATSRPGVNTRVTSYLDWILSNTDQDFCDV
ncbi:venom serine protease [Anabrus simplex]|uniref:venom serine protease n=1 Tax=Anabrus simplex TaxID=316456 RepID=UPI0035A2BB8E